jgi:hypothetical protein
MGEIENSIARIERLNENPIYQEYLKIMKILGIGEQVANLIESEKRYIEELKQQQIMQQQQHQQQLMMQQQMMQQQMMQQPQQMMQQQIALPRGRPPKQQQFAMPQNLDRFGNPITSQQKPQEQIQIADDDIGVKEEAPIADGLPEWENEQ